MFANLPVRHVGVLPRRAAFESLALIHARLLHLLAHLSAAAADLRGGQFLVGDRRHFDVNVDPIQQRAAPLNRLHELNFVRNHREK